MPRIDAHHHVWDLTVRDQPWTVGLPALHRSFSVEELQASLHTHDIQATIVVQTLAIPDETSELLALAASNNTVAGVIGWVDLVAPDVSIRLDRIRTLAGGRALVGIRHPVQDEPDPTWLCRAEVRRGLAAVGGSGLVYDLLVTPGQLAAVADTVRALPGVRFVLDHGGKPPIAENTFEVWHRTIVDLAREPNIAVKLSGLVTEAGTNWSAGNLLRYATALLDAFGPDRTMFGSDWPVCLTTATYADVVDVAERALVGCGAAEREAVFGGTAASWYGLSQ